MNARRKLIAALSEDSLGGIATLSDVDHAIQLVDAYRTEAITKAVGRLRAVPVDCTALTGPVWYGDGWNAAITTFEEIADYQKPDDEAYPGELQKLRALFLGLRAALLRRDDVEWARQQLISLAEHEARERSGQTADFFQPGRTYRAAAWEFRCDAFTRHPETSDHTALGWLRVGNSGWTTHSYTAADWGPEWADITDTTQGDSK